MVGDVGVGKNVIDTYFVKIDPEEFDALKIPVYVEQMGAKEFLGAPRTELAAKEGIICAGGISYFVEATADDKSNLIRRTSCDRNFKSDFEESSSLLDLAIKRIPMLSDQLIAIRDKIAAHQHLLEPVQ